MGVYLSHQLTTKNKNMETLKTKIKQAETAILIQTLTSIFQDMSKMGLNILIQEELENRIGEEKLDDILDAIR